MSLTNYRDIGAVGSDVGAGFQFEFYCGNCARTWKSPFAPYRRARFAGIVYKLATFLGDRGTVFRASDAVAKAGAKGARDSALARALELAEQRYTECPACLKAVCEECWNPGAKACEACATKGVRSAGGHVGSGSAEEGRESHAAVSSAGPRCPNCSSALDGGRFCAECGFDMASTHKSCPGCGTLCIRSARFCTDCGHGF
jgi:hypothetical protein